MSSTGETAQNSCLKTQPSCQTCWGPALIQPCHLSMFSLQKNAKKSLKWLPFAKSFMMVYFRSSASFNFNETSANKNSLWENAVRFMHDYRLYSLHSAEMIPIQENGLHSCSLLVPMCCDLSSVANQKTKSALSPKGNSDCGAARLFAKLYRRGSNSPNSSIQMLSCAIVFEGKISWLRMNIFFSSGILGFLCLDQYSLKKMTQIYQVSPAPPRF